MNRKMVYFLVGRILLLEGGLLLLPLGVSLYYGDNGLVPFLIGSCYLVSGRWKRIPAPEKSVE